MESLISPLISYLNNQRLITDFAFVSAATVVIYDCLLTLHLEIRLIWLSKWTYTKVLFLLIRYTVFGSMVLILHDQTFPNVSYSRCRVTFPVSVWLLASQICLAEAILAIRTWAIWRRNKVIGIGLGFLTAANIVTQCVMLNKFVKSMKYAPSPYTGFRGCLITDASRLL